MDNFRLDLFLFFLLLLLFVFFTLIYFLIKKDTFKRRKKLLLESQKKDKIGKFVKKKGLTLDQRSQIVEDFQKQAGRKITTKLDLENKFIYARWKISPILFRFLQVLIGIFVWSFVQIKFNMAVQITSLFSGMVLLNGLLNRSINKRFKAYDADYAQFLQSLVALIKTGMNPTTAIDAVAKNLDESSLVRVECEIMLERLKYGASEEQSIGSFAEDILHPEIELFVQALLLSRSVGGRLSDTLDRLASQVRARSIARREAKAAVGMQRGSIWAILFIMAGVLLFLAKNQPEMIFGAIKDDIGWEIWQYGGLGCLYGFIWVRTMTNIKV